MYWLDSPAQRTALPMSLGPYARAPATTCYSAAHLEPFCGTAYMIASRVSRYLPYMAGILVVLVPTTIT